MSTNGYIVRELIIRNFKAARKITIYNAGPGVIEVTGANEAGKTSTLQALPALCAGLSYKDDGLKLWDGDCLTHGAVKGQLTAVLASLEETGEAELDGLSITRKFTAENQRKGGSLLIKAADGSKRKQGDLNAIVGEFGFDPTEWGAQSLEDQLRSLDELIDPGIARELGELDSELDEAETARRETGREIKAFGQIPNLPKVDPVDTAELVKALRAAESHNKAQDKRREHRDTAQDHCSSWAARIERLKSELDEAEQKLAAEQSTLASIPVPDDPIDTEPLQSALAQAGETNAKAEQWRAAEEQRAKLSKLTRRQNAHDQKIEDLREQRRQLAMMAKTPIDGLEWGPNGVVWNGTTWAKLSSSQKLRLTMKIEAARHPLLRVMLLRNADLLDDDRFREVCEFAREERYQVWAESVRGARTEDAIEIVLGEYGQSEPWEE